MKVTFKHQIVSSFLLWLEHEVLANGEAFTNHSSLLYDIEDVYSNYYIYGLPFKKIVSDTSITNANIMSGIYVDGTFTNVGQNGLVDIDYYNGWAYFSSDKSANVLSGDYSVPDFSISYTDLNEEKLVFESKYDTKPRWQEELTGLAPNTLTVPHIFVKVRPMENEPFCFGGTEQTKYDVRLVAMGQENDSFILDGLESICLDTRGKYIKIVPENNQPFNVLGGWQSGVAFNYNGFINSLSNPETLYIERVSVSRISSSVNTSNFLKLSPYLTTFIDLELTTERNPRVYV